MRARGDRGATAVETGLLIAGIAAAIMGVATVSGQQVQSVLEATIAALGGS